MCRGIPPHAEPLILLLQQNTLARMLKTMDAQAGDKVRLKRQTHRGKRGVVQKLRAANLVVRLTESDELVQVSATEVTNYSLAARMAWERMPYRRVGRPKGSATTDRVSVTLRIDRELWEQFKRAESAGRIEDRTAAINAWIAERLSELGE
jgi:uncharacterized protein (DUF4415 family)